MKVLITGGAGQDGSYLVDSSVKLGWDVHATYRSSEQALSSPPGVSAHIVDVAVPGSLRELIDLIRPERIYHMAGITSVARSWGDPEATFQTIAMSTIELLQAAWRMADAGDPIRVLNASSAEIFGAPEIVFQDENTAISPVSPYGIAKAAGHQMAQLLRSRGLRCSNAILFNHESPRRGPEFVTKKIARGVARIKLGLDHEIELGNLKAVRDWGWAPDFIVAMESILELDSAGDYVIATGSGHSVEDFVAACFESVGIVHWREHIVSSDALFRPTETPALVGNAGKLREDTGWAPTKSFEEIAKTLVEFEISEIANADAPEGTKQ